MAREEPAVLVPAAVTFLRLVMAHYLIIFLALIVLLPLTQGMFTMHARQSIETAISSLLPGFFFLLGCLGVQG